MSKRPLSGSSKQTTLMPRIINPTKDENWKAARHPNQAMISVLSVDTGPPNWAPKAYMEYANVRDSGGNQSVIRLYEHGPETALKKPTKTLSAISY